MYAYSVTSLLYLKQGKDVEIFSAQNEEREFGTFDSHKGKFKGQTERGKQRITYLSSLSERMAEQVWGFFYLEYIIKRQKNIKSYKRLEIVES